VRCAVAWPGTDAFPMKKPISLFALALLAGLVLAAAGYVMAVRWVGRGYCTEKYVPYMLAYKLERLRQTKSPRLIILSGSNAQDCIDCESLERTIGMDVVCAGTVVTIPMRFYVPMLEETLGPGDVVYLPLEANHYTRERSDLTSPFGVSLLWGVYQPALATLSVDERVGLYARKGLGWLQLTLAKRLNGSLPPPCDPAEVYASVQRRPGHPEVGFILPWGSLDRDGPPTFPPETGIGSPGEFSDEFRESLQAIKALADARGARVVLGHVVSYGYWDDAWAEGFHRRLADLGFPVCSRAAALCLPYGCFLDYPLHCNATGRTLVTREVADGLCRILGRPVADRRGWALQTFPPGAGARVTFPQRTSCVGRPTCAEFILDRDVPAATNVVSEVRVNGRPVPYREIARRVKTRLLVRWTNASDEVTVEIVTCAGRRVSVERVLMERDMDRELDAVKDVNDWTPAFTRDPVDPHRFVCRAVNAEEAYLRLRIPDWGSCRYRFNLTLKASEPLAGVSLGGARYRNDLVANGSEGREYRTSVVPGESSAFVDADGSCTVGFCFKPQTLRPGLEITVSASREEL